MHRAHGDHILDDFGCVLSDQLYSVGCIYNLSGAALIRVERRLMVPERKRE